MPQINKNFQRKSVEGMSFDMVVYNIFGFAVLTVYSLVTFIIESRTYDISNPSTTLQDIFFAVSCFICCVTLGVQILCLDRGTSKWSIMSKGIFGALMLGSGVLAVLAWQNVIPWTPYSDWPEKIDENNLPQMNLWSFVNCLSYFKICINIFKYTPQIYENYLRKNVDGYSALGCSLDFFGGVFSLLQALILGFFDSNWKLFNQNIPKTAISMLSIFYTGILMIQVFILYPKKRQAAEDSNEEVESGDALSVASADGKLEKPLLVDALDVKV